jgi:hypothetical protein
MCQGMARHLEGREVGRKIWANVGTCITYTNHMTLLWCDPWTVLLQQDTESWLIMNVCGQFCVCPVRSEKWFSRCRLTTPFDIDVHETCGFSD